MVCSIDSWQLDTMGIRKHRKRAGSLKPLTTEIYEALVHEHEAKQIRRPVNHEQNLLEWDDITGRQ